MASVLGEPNPIATEPKNCSLATMRRLLNLKHLLALSISILTCALIAIVTLTIGQAGVRRVEAEIGASLGILADQMQDKLDRAIFERYREIGIAARISQIPLIADRSDVLRAWLIELQSSYPDYAWIGYADHNGKVVHATGGLLEGVDVSGQAWFRAGLKEPAVGDVHQSEFLAAALSRRSETAPLYLYIAAPVVNASGDTIGVIGAHLDWSWVNEVRDSLFGITPAGRTEQVLVLTGAGVVLLGPPELTGSLLTLKSVQAAMTGANRFASEEWPDGGRYVTGYARSDGYRNFTGLGWIVLVRQDADVALAPARQLQRQTIIWGFGLAGLAACAAWMLSGQIAAPLLRLANSADAIRKGQQVEIPHVGGYAEAETLSRSLDALVFELKQRQVSLKEFNRSLELQVAERTSELAARNIALSLAREEAEGATATKSRFLAVASHDLRQPLHAITLFARALSRRVSGEEAQHLVAQLESSLASLKEMFDALLDVSRLDAGLIEPNITNISVKELVERITGGFRAEASGRGLTFKSRSINATIATDPVLLETMLRNLLSNSLKFTRAGGVLLAGRRRNGHILFEVYDTGPGISSDRQTRIYEEFERSKEHATGTNDGLGLGLSIVHRYASLLGIQIKLASRVGHGTRVSLALPEGTMNGNEAPRDADAPVPAATVLRTLQGASVFVIDDDPQIIAGTERELTDRGCRVLSFPTIPEANAALLAGLRFDVAIVDFDLGNDQTGPALLDAAERARGQRIPALILTGGTDAATLAAVMKTGRPWLTKPAEPDTVAIALSDLIAATSTA